MIAFIHGVIEYKTKTSVVVEIDGIGYDAGVPTIVADQLPEIGEKIKLFTYYYFNRDNEPKLYGFISRDQLRVFTISTTVKGVGPALGMSIVSKLDPDQFRIAIRDGDHTTLMRVPRVNKETAQLMIMSLKKKIDKIDFDGSIDDVTTAKRNDEAIKALIGLGGSEDASEKSVAEAIRILGENAKVEDITRLALRYLSKFSE